MMRTIGAWAATLWLVTASAALAQEAATDTPKAPAETRSAEAEIAGDGTATADETAPAEGPAPAAPSPQDCDCPAPEPCRRQSVAGEGEQARGPMGDFGLTLKLGPTGQGKRKYRIDGQDQGKLDGKTGLLVAMAFNTGDGHGFGSDVGFVLRRFNDGGVKSGTFAFEPILGGRFHLKGPAYLFVGLGPSLGLRWSDVPNQPKSGVAGFRIPVQGTVYFWRKFAAVIEVGLGWDAAVTVDEDPADPEAKVAYIDTGMTWDLAFGLRFF